MSKRQIYLVFSCDEWQSRDSMRLMMATTSARKVKSFIAAKIEDDTFCYDDCEASKTEQVSRFKKDFDTETSRTVTSKLAFGCFDYAYDGEEL